MEDIVVAIVFLAIAVISRTAKRKKSARAVEAHRAMQEHYTGDAKVSESKLRMEEMRSEASLKATPPVAAAKVVAQQEKSMKKTPVQDHVHEGRQDVLCPAEEREMLRQTPVSPKKSDAPTIPGLNLKFDNNTVLQGFVMSEILNRPRSGMRR